MAISPQYFRARDVRANVKELGFEKGIVMSLELMADELAGIRQTSKENAQILSELIDRFTEMTNVGSALATQLHEMKRQEEQFNAIRGQGIIPNGDGG